MPPSALRLLFYCQDSAGLGHLRRAVTLADHLLCAWPNSEALIVTRTSATHALFALPPQCDVIKLPSMARVGPDEHGEIRTLAGSEPERYRHLRTGLLRETVRDFRPHLLHVDNEPQGLQDELRPALDELHASQPESAAVFGLRDIRGSGQHVRRSWTEKGIYAVLERFYHAILIYGERDIFDVAAEYALPPALAERVTYGGYVVQPGRNASSPTEVRQALAVPDGVPIIAVTAGSGADGLPIMRAFVEVFPQVLARRPAHGVIVTGPLMGEEDRAVIRQALATGLPLTVRETFDTYALMAAARAIICRGGYNSVAEAISLGRRPLVIPRRTRSGEQEVRASRFAARGWCATLSEDDLAPERLAGQIGALLDAPPAPVPDVFNRDRALARVEAALRSLVEARHG